MDDICVICLYGNEKNNYLYRAKECYCRSTVYHISCMNDYLETNTKCPTCRKELNIKHRKKRQKLNINCMISSYVIVLFFINCLLLINNNNKLYIIIYLLFKFIVKLIYLIYLNKSNEDHIFIPFMIVKNNKINYIWFNIIFL